MPFGRKVIHFVFNCARPVILKRLKELHPESRKKVPGGFLTLIPSIMFS